MIPGPPRLPLFVWLGFIQFGLIIGMLGTALVRLAVPPFTHRVMAVILATLVTVHMFLALRFLGYI